MEGEEAAERGRGGKGAKAGDDVAAGLRYVLGQLVKRVLDCGAELLQRGTVVGARRQAGVDGVGQLTRQGGTKAAQRPGATADGAGRGGRSGAPVRVFAAPALVQGEGERVDVALGPGRLPLG